MIHWSVQISPGKTFQKHIDIANAFLLNGSDHNVSVAVITVVIGAVVGVVSRHIDGIEIQPASDAVW